MGLNILTMKKSILVLFISLFCCYKYTLANNPNCTILIQINNFDAQNFQYLSISDKDNIYHIDTVGNQLDSICLYINAPIKATLQLGDITPENIHNNILPLWLHKGRYIVYADIKNNKIDYGLSPINIKQKEINYYLDSLRNIKRYNLLLDSLYLLKEQTDSSIALIKRYSTEREEYEEIVTREMFDYYSKDKSSFLTLDFISFHLGTMCRYIAKDKLMGLFNQLDPSLSQYKKYYECKDIFNSDSIQPPPPILNIKM